MLIKLLKYDLKYMVKNMSVFYILIIFFAILTRLFSTNSSFIIHILSQICSGCMIAMIFNIIINVLMRSWVRFRDSIYKDEAYLTHTLPVSKNDIYNSKFMQTLIFFVISFIVILISLFIAYYTQESWELLKNFVNNFTASLNFSTIFFVISILFILFLEIFDILQCGYLGILLGYKKNDIKVGFSFLFGFMSYILSQSLVLLVIYIIGLFNSGIMNLFKNNAQIDSNTFKLLVILLIVIYLIMTWLINILCKKIFNKGVNIE